MNRHPTLALLGASCLAAAFWPAVAAAAAGTQPYQVTVQARVVFGQDGRAQDIVVIEAEKQPAAFVSAVKDRLARARIEPPTVQGAPATLGTGVAMAFEVTPAADGGQGQVRVIGMSLQPLLVRMDLLAMPKDAFAAGETERAVTIQCSVDVEGRCAQLGVTGGPDMPEAVRRWARATTDAWRFEPQTLNGRPIEGNHEVRLVVSVEPDLKPEDFRQDKFNRAASRR